MGNPIDKPFLKGIQGKVIAAFLLACTAIFLALSITYYSFEGLLTTVDDLTTPNARLRSLNNLFQKITALDQQQRADAIRNPAKSNGELLKESQDLISIIDTLQAMHWQNKEQLSRLNTMEEILHQRDELFLSYLKLKSDLVYNKNLSIRLDTLSRIISRSYSGSDTTVTTTQKIKTTTTYHSSDKAKDTESPSFLGRLFGKKKNATATDPQVEVLEELSVQIDTLSVARQDSAIAEVERIMAKLETDQRLQNQQMLKRELDLISANTALINQLLYTLREVEKEEQLTQTSNTEKAASLVSSSIKRIGTIMIIFFLSAALLVFLILIDITRSNSLRKQLVHAKEEAEQLSQVKQRFLANMSHEIRTPLQSIVGFAEQLKQSEKSNHAIDAIYNSSEHLLHIVNEVLDYSRIESGKLTLVKEPFCLKDLIHEVASVIVTQAEKRKLTFVVDANEAVNTWLTGDAFRLRQILYNLLGNAIKFTEKGHVKLSAEVKEEGQRVRCIFRVSDTGIGMQQQDLDRIFQSFEQAHIPGRHQDGTGLGLTIVKRLVEAQHGTIHAASEHQNGSTFTVDLCYDRAPDELPHTYPVVHGMQNSKFDGKVMLVDDDETILNLCSSILRKYDIEHVTFNDAEKALQAIPENNPDKNLKLILLDIRMPRMNGIEACMRLRKKINGDTRIVALTAHVLPQEREALLQKGFDLVLTKPFRESDLLKLMGISEKKGSTAGTSAISLDNLEKMTMGDDVLFRTIVSQFIEDTTDDIEKIESDLPSMKEGEVREIVHKLAGRTGQIGINELSDRFRTIESELHKGKKLNSLSDSLLTATADTKIILDQLRKMQHDPLHGLITNHRLN